MKSIVGIFSTFLLSACAGGESGGDTASLSEWRSVGEPVWSFEDDLASAGSSERTGFLVSPEAYSDFTLEVEFWIEDNTNSGIFIRCRDSQDVSNLNPDDCYEINIWDNHPVQDFRTGSIVKRAVPDAEVHTIDRWNRMLIRAEGESIEVSVNDVQTVTYADSQLSVGVVALQYAGKERLKLRNLRIKPSDQS